MKSSNANSRLKAMRIQLALGMSKRTARMPARNTYRKQKKRFNDSVFSGNARSVSAPPYKRKKMQCANA